MKKSPLLFSLIVLVFIILLNRLPLSDIIGFLGLNEFNSNSLVKIIFDSITIICILLLIIKKKVPFSIFNLKFENSVYYIPLFFYFFLFFDSIDIGNIFEIEFLNLTFYSIRVFISVLLEEVLFRGLILGLFLNKFYNSKNGILKSVLLSGLLFGSIHIINIWTQPNMSLQGVTNQIYAACGMGVLYGAVYLKTKNILVLTFFHFCINFFALLGELHEVKTVQQVEIIEPSQINIIISEILRIIVFGIPFAIGVWIIFNTDKKELKTFVRK